MSDRTVFLFLVGLVVVVSLLNNDAEGRYLPTRSGYDKLDKLKELLREFLENEIDKEDGDSQPRWHPENKLFYKREIPTQ